MNIMHVEGLDDIIFAYEETRTAFEQIGESDRFNECFDLINYTEPGIATENLSDNLLDFEIGITPNVYEAICRACDVYKLDPRYKLQLQQLIRS